MTAIGTVAEILASNLLLIQSESDFDVDDVLVVFAEVPVAKLTKKHGLQSIQYPKGRVSVLAKQDKDFYLAETFRPIVETQVVEKVPSLLGGLFPTEVIKKNVPGEPSATLADATMPFSVSNYVEVGDKVSRP